MARYTSGNSGKGSEDNVIYANFGAGKHLAQRRDVRRYLGWLADNGIDDLADVDRGMVEEYLKFLRG